MKNGLNVDDVFIARDVTKQSKLENIYHQPEQLYLLQLQRFVDFTPVAPIIINVSSCEII